MTLPIPTPKDGHEARFLELFSEMLDHPSPPGREQSMSAYIRRQVEAMGYACEEDAARNLLVRLPGRDPKAPSAIVAAHMDEIGLVVTSVEADGTLRVDRSGILKPFKLGERPLQFLGDHQTIIGVPSLGGGHGAAAVNLETWSETKIITGLTRAELEACGIRPGTSAVPLREGRGPVLFGSPDKSMVGAWTFDDRAGVAVLLMLLESLKSGSIQPPGPVIIAFTVHEEGGCHGAKFLGARERPTTFIAIDGCPHVPGCGYEVSEHPVCWSKDTLGNYDQDLIGSLISAGKTAGCKVQTGVLTSAYSDASSVYAMGGAGKVACFGHARYNSHGFEVARLAVFPNVLKTLLAFFQKDAW